MKTKLNDPKFIKHWFLQAILIAFFMLFTLYSYAQQGVSINVASTPADPSAMLDVSSPSKGLLIPRVSLMSINDITTIPSPATSLLVYNTNAAMVGGAVGFWYFNGTIWVQAIGPQGIQGPVGTTGPQGVQGTVGATGPQGLQGVQGATGPQGIQGAVGATGPQGLQGVQGASGPQGIQGAVGATGPQGLQGVQGATGPQGIQGAVGATGPQGLQGVQGATGPQGVQGAVGATGPQGLQGVQGATGPQGIQGAVGPAGATGAAGPVGCSTANMVLKSNGTAATCSQIIDNGTYVGIGTTSPSEKLDVSGNIKFSAALMPNNQSGSSGQILVSQGAGAAPVWQNPATVPMYGNNAHSVKLTTIQGTSSATYTDIPGMTLTVNTVHNTFYVFASFTARLAMPADHFAAFGQAIVNAQILVDGVSQARAASVITDYDYDNYFGEIVVTSGGVAFNGIPITLTPGSHTIKLQWSMTGYYQSGAWVEINPVSFTDTGDHCILTIFD